MKVVLTNVNIEPFFDKYYVPTKHFHFENDVKHWRQTVRKMPNLKVSLPADFYKNIASCTLY